MLEACLQALWNDMAIILYTKLRKKNIWSHGIFMSTTKARGPHILVIWHTCFLPDTTFPYTYMTNHLLMVILISPRYTLIAHINFFSAEPIVAVGKWLYIEGYTWLKLYNYTTLVYILHRQRNCIIVAKSWAWKSQLASIPPNAYLR